MSAFTPENRHLPRWFVRLLFLVSGIFLTLFLLETGLRAAWGIFHMIPSARNIDPFCFPTETVELRQGQGFTGFYQFDDRLVRRWIPNVRGLTMELRGNGENGEYITLAANEHGWRDVPHALEKPPNTFRIAVIGDSFGEPWRRPSEVGIPRQLENWLKQQGHTSVEVINFSISGNNPVDYSAIIHYEAPLYAPDLIIVLLYPANDVIDGQFVDLLSDTRTVDGRIVYTPEWVESVRQTYADKNASPAEDASLTWQDLAAAEQEGRVAVAHTSPDGTYSYAVHLPAPRDVTPPHLRFHCFAQHTSYLYTWLKERVRIVGDTADSLDRLRRLFLVYQSHPTAVMEAGWQQYEQLLLQMAADAAAQHSHIAFVTLAVGEQVYPPVMARELGWLGYQAQNYDANYPQERTRRYCTSHQLDCWFLLPAFQQADATSDVQLFDYYDPHDPTNENKPGHYTPSGYALAARTIGEAILERGWLNG